jgi:hypothetical protein
MPLPDTAGSSFGALFLDVGAASCRDLHTIRGKIPLLRVISIDSAMNNENYSMSEGFDA